MSASPAQQPTPRPADHRYAVTHGSVYLTGIQALTRTLVERARLDRRAGRQPAVFVSGYEGSPLAGFDLELARHPVLLAEHGVVHRPGLNEELAATAVAGSQLAGRIGTLRRTTGVTGFWYGKAPGLDRACDALRHANIVGADPHGGAVAFVGDDPGAKSSTIPSASEMALADLYIPVFYPADTQDILDHTRHAVQLSRASGLWTGVKLTTTVADGSGTTRLDPDWIAPDLSDFERRPYSHTPEGRVLGARLTALERDLYETRIPLSLEYIRRSDLNKVCGDPHARVGIVVAGKTYRDVCQALATLGLDVHNLQHSGVRLLKLDVISPLEPSALLDFARGLDEIIVVEEKRSFLETAVRERLYGRTGAPAVYGKTTPDGGILFSQAGELDPDTVARALADRGGAVISDLKLTCGPHTGAAKLAAGECDLHIGADGLVAVEPGQLATLSPDRTVTVVSTGRVPTGAMVVDPRVTYPDPTRIREVIDNSCRETHYLDAAGQSEALFGSAQFANMLLVGAAYQTGALPISAKAIEQAIAINGVAVDVNVQAFRHGRRLVATEVDQVAEDQESDRLESLLAVRVPDLVGYQNQRYAQSYVDFVHQVAATENTRCPGSTSITEAVARYLYKLMAYKDEYEVARLSLDPALTTDLKRQFGTGARFSHQLQPPVLRALGMKKKIVIGAAGRPAFRALRAMRGLRGSRFDPFGHAHIRRVERALIAEYRDVMENALSVLTPGNHPLVLQLAELPDLVRGYEQVKQKSVDEYRHRMGELLAELGAAASPGATP